MAAFKKTTDPTVPPGQTIASGFPVLHVGDVPRFDPATWRLKFYGLVSAPFELTWDELRAEPTVEWRGDIHCVTRWSKRDTSWRGVPFARFVARARPLPDAKFVVQHAANDYTTNLPVAAMLGEDVLLATEFDGEPLEPIHGGPVRAFVPKLYLWKSAKWIHGFEFIANDRPGFWEKRGYHNEGDPWKEERYADIPSWFG